MGRGVMPSTLGIVHVHSDYSHDGRDTLHGLAEFAAARDIGFIGLTDHAEDFSALRWDEYVRACGAASSDVVRLIPGLEFRFAGFRGLHLLAFGLVRWIEPTTPDEFITLAGPASRLTALPRPSLYAQLRLIQRKLDKQATSPSSLPLLPPQPDPSL